MIEYDEKIEVKTIRFHYPGTIPKPPSEADIEKLVSFRLTEDGIEHDRQKRIGDGIADIFVYQNPPKIIEVKLDGGFSTIQRAVGQLKYYGSFYPKAELYICIPNGVPHKYLSFLEQIGIKQWGVTKFSFVELEYTPEILEAGSSAIQRGVCRDWHHACMMMLDNGFKKCQRMIDEIEAERAELFERCPL